MNTALGKSSKLADYDNFIITLLFLAMIFFLYQFYNHNYESPFDSKKEKIAQLLSSKNIVKRKFTGQTSWFDVKGGQDLYVNDFVYSHDDSEAQIKFENNDQIQISPNTLFQLKKHNDQIEMGLTSGSFVANFSNESGSRELTVNVQGKNIVLKPVGESKLIIGVSDKGTEITLAKGEMKINGREIKVSQKVTLDGKDEKQNNWQVQDLNIKIESPADNAKYYFDGSQDILFRLKDKRNGQYRFIASKDVSFRDIIDQKEFSSPVVGWSFSEDGTYYWKVQEYSAENKIIGESIPQSFFAIKKITPTWKNPEDENLQIIESSPKNIRLDWYTQGTTLFDVEVRHNNQLELQTVQTNSFSYTPKEGGLFDFRVRTKYDDHYSDWSAHKIVQVSYLQTPPVPEFLDYPTPEALYYLHPSYPVQIRFAWKMLMGLRYHFQLKADEKVKFDEEITQNFYEHSIEKSVDLKWRLRSIHALGVYSSWTPWMQSNITVHRQDKDWLPIDGSEVVLSRPDQLTQFQWGATSEEVEFELAKDENFQNIIHRKRLLESQLEIPIAEVGTYYWRTRYVSASGKTMYSPPIRVKFRPTPPPGKPEIDSEILIKIKKRAKRTSLFNRAMNLIFPQAYAADDDAAEIKLQKNSQAKFYHVQIFKTEGMEELLYETKSKKEIIKWKKANAGTYYLRYSIIDHWEQEGPFSDLSKLKIEMETDKKNENKKQTALNQEVTLHAPVVLFKRKNAEIGIGLSPTMFSFEETHSTHTANYDGVAWESLQLSIHKSFSQIETDINTRYSKGKVFTNQDFSYLQGNLSFLYNFENPKWIKPELGLSLEKYNFYAYQNATSLTAENKSFTGIFVGGMLSFVAPITIKANYTLGESAGPSVILRYHYQNWLPEVFYHERSYAKSSDEVSFTAIGVGVSYLYSWQ